MTGRGWSATARASATFSRPTDGIITGAGPRLRTTVTRVPSVDERAGAGMLGQRHPARHTRPSSRRRPPPAHGRAAPRRRRRLRRSPVRRGTRVRAGGASRTARGGHPRGQQDDHAQGGGGPAAGRRVDVAPRRHDRSRPGCRPGCPPGPGGAPRRVTAGGAGGAAGAGGSERGAAGAAGAPTPHRGPARGARSAAARPGRRQPGPAPGLRLPAGVDERLGHLGAVGVAVGWDPWPAPAR